MNPNDTLALPDGRVGIIIDSPTHGVHVALVDAGDYPTVAEHRWHLLKTGLTYYARADMRGPDGVRRGVLLHRHLLPSAREVDHFDRNGLNNTRANIRAVSRQENVRNQRVQSRNTSGFRGVGWHKQKSRWRARIHVDGVTRHLGLFDDLHAAARAFDEEARKAGYPQTALNFPVSPI